MATNLRACLKMISWAAKRLFRLSEQNLNKLLATKFARYSPF